MDFKYPFDERITESLTGNTETALVGFYGDKETLKNALEVYLNHSFSLESGFYLVLNDSKTKAALVYSSGSDPFYTEKDESKAFLCYMISICLTIVPCLSKYHVERWYYSENAFLHSNFNRKFRQIAAERLEFQSIVLKEKKKITKSALNSGNLFVSKQFAYEYKDNLYDSDNLIQFKKLSSGLILDIFRVTQNELSSKFYNFLNEIDQMVYCRPEKIKEIFETLNDLHLKYCSEIPQVYSKMCDIIKAELFDNNQKLTDSTVLKNDSIFELFREEIMKNPKHFKSGKIKTIFMNLMKKYLDSNELDYAESLIDQKLKDADREASTIREYVKTKALENVSVLETFLIKQTLTVLQYDLQELINLVPDVKTSEINLTSSIQLGRLKTIKTMTNNSFACLFENSEIGVTHLVYILNGAEYVHKVLQGTNFEIAEGSIEDFLVVVDNSKYLVSVLAIEERVFVSKFEKNNETIMKSPHILIESPQLLFIDDAARLNVLDLASKNPSKFYDLSRFAINTSCYPEKFLMLSISENSEMMCIRLSNSLIVFHRNEDLIFKLDINNHQFRKALILSLNSEYLLVIVNKSGSSIYEITFKKDRQDRGYRNYIIDVLEDAALLVLKKFLIKVKEVRVFIQPGYSLDNIDSYFSVLKTISQYCKFRPVFITEDIFIPSTTLEALANTLLHYSSCKVFDLNPFQPFLKPGFSIENSRIQPIVSQIRKNLNFGYFESEFRRINEVTLVSVIGDNPSIVKRLLQSVFHLDVVSQEEGAFLYYSKIEGKDFAVLAVILNKTELTRDSSKVYETVGALSDFILLPVWMKSHNHVPRVVSELFYCQGKLNDHLYNFQFDFLVFDWNENKPNNNKTYIKESLSNMQREAYVALFGTVDSLTYLAECLVYQKRLAKFKSRYSGAELFETLKLVLAQVTTGDTHSQEYWNSRGSYLGSFLENNPCDLKHQICDYEISLVNKDYRRVPMALPLNHQSAHLCDQQCFKCSCYCQLEYGHFGYHSSKQHFACDIEFINKKLNDYKNAKYYDRKDLKTDWRLNNWETPEESSLGFLNN